jgi:signal transduction histidine kinase
MTRWWHRIPPAAVDAALAGLFVVVAQVELHHKVDDGYQAGPLWLNVPLVLLMTAPLALRRTAPTLALGVMVGAAVVPGLFVAHTLFFWGSLVPMAIATYSLARHRDNWPARHAWLTGPVLLLGNVAHVAELRTPSNIFFAGGVFGVAWLVGRVLRRLTVQEAALQRALDRLAEEQQLREEAAAVGERRRIAAEMHDVVAHAVSLMTVQVGAARMLLESGGGAVPPQLRAAEETGRQAVAELRRTLGVMRSAADQGELHPVPDLAALPGLVEQFAEAGLRTELDVVPPPGLPASIQLAAYRIVQEALTNVVKHAGPVGVTVSVRGHDKDLVVAVRNEPGAESTMRAGGHGLAGMRERVAMFGGTLEARGTDDGGFAVVARLSVPELVEVSG